MRPDGHVSWHGGDADCLRGLWLSAEQWSGVQDGVAAEARQESHPAGPFAALDPMPMRPSFVSRWSLLLQILGTLRPAGSTLPLQCAW